MYRPLLECGIFDRPPWDRPFSRLFWLLAFYSLPFFLYRKFPILEWPKAGFLTGQIFDKSCFLTKFIQIVERNNLGPISKRKDQDWSFLRFLLNFSIFLLELLNFCENMLKISNKNIENCRKNRRKDQFWSYLDWSFPASSLSRLWYHYHENTSNSQFSTEFESYRALYYSNATDL